MSDGPRPGGAPRPHPRPPDPAPPRETRSERRARLATSPLITEAPPLTDAQRDRLAVLLAPMRKLVSA